MIRVVDCAGHQPALQCMSNISFVSLFDYLIDICLQCIDTAGGCCKILLFSNSQGFPIEISWRTCSKQKTSWMFKRHYVVIIVLVPVGISSSSSSSMSAAAATYTNSDVSVI